LFVLTYYVEVYEVSDGGRGADLALVDAGVLALGVLDAQNPVLGVRRVDRLEALVACVSVPPHGEQVDVAVPHPRNLFFKIKHTLFTRSRIFASQNELWCKKCGGYNCRPKLKVMYSSV